MGSSRPLRVVWFWNVRMAYGPQQDGVQGLQEIDAPAGIMPAPAEEVREPQSEFLKRKSDAVFLSGPLKTRMAWDHFPPTPSPGMTPMVNVFMDQKTI